MQNAKETQSQVLDLAEDDNNSPKKGDAERLKIVAISDIRDWSPFRRMLENEAPDYLLIAGGAFNSFNWQKNKEETKEFIRQSLNSIGELDKDAWRTSALSFNYLFYLLCALKFYSAIRFAAKTCKVLVIKSGYEDEWFARACFEEFYGKNLPAFPAFPMYDANRIGSIANCAEITGRIVDTDGFRILGLGFDDIRRMRNLEPIIGNARKNPPGIVLARRLPASEFRPRLQIVCSALKPKLYISSSAPTTNSTPIKFKLDNTWVTEAGNFPNFITVIKIEANTVSDLWFSSPR